MREVKVGEIYRHFKGKEYKVIAIAYDSETSHGTNPEKMVVYEALYGDHLIWVRPYDLFVSKVDRNKYPDVDIEYRFEKVEI